MANTVRTGTIDLSSTREIDLTAGLSNVYSIELYSADLSADTTVNVKESVGGVNYDDAKESGVAITGTLSASSALVFTILGKHKNHYKFEFDGATTGNVTYTINR